MDKFLKTLNLQMKQNGDGQSQMLIVAGNDKTFKLQLAAKLTSTDKPNSFDFANGISIIGTKDAQALILGSNPAFISSAQMLMQRPIQIAVLMYSLANITELITQLREWVPQLTNSRISLVISDYDSFKTVDPQTLQITFRLLRQLCALNKAQLFTVFDYQQMFDCVTGIKTGKGSRINEEEFHFFIAEPEAFDKQKHDEYMQLYLKNIHVQQKQVQKINLQTYLQRVEQKSKCGKDFDCLME